MSCDNESWGLYAGIGRFPGKSQGCARAYKESNGDEQDPEAGQCWDCPDKINGLEMRRSCA